MAERAHPDLPEFQNKLFGLKRNPYRKLFFQRHKFCNRFLRNKKVLDIPCGVGWGTSLLKGREVFGVDISEKAIEYALKHYGKRFLVGNMNSIPFRRNAFDVVVCLEGFEHVDKYTAIYFLTEARRVLSNSGLIIVTTPLLNDGKHSGNPYHIHEYEKGEFLEIMESHFKNEYMDYVPSPESKILRYVGRT